MDLSVAANDKPRLELRIDAMYPGVWGLEADYFYASYSGWHSWGLVALRWHLSVGVKARAQRDHKDWALGVVYYPVGDSLPERHWLFVALWRWHKERKWGHKEVVPPAPRERLTVRKPRSDGFEVEG